MYPRSTYPKHYMARMTPFRIIGNVYFVGNYLASAHLVDTGDGLILLDTGYADTLHLLVESVWELGFNPRDIKYIIHSHWHGDHTAATEAMAALCGAKTVISRVDAPYLAPNGYFTPDILLEDGDVLTLGNTSIRCMLTPGHTIGTMSFFFDTTENGTTYRVGTFGGAGVNTLVPTAKSFYADCRRDYLNSIDKLLKEPVDVFIGNHCWNNDTRGKGELLKLGASNPFIDSEEWVRFLNFCRERCLGLPPVE